MKTAGSYSCALLLFVLGVSFSTTCAADGISFTRNGRIAGPSTLIPLTEGQAVEIRYARRAVYISLTGAQTRRLKARTGFAPKRIRVWSRALAKDGCTCEALNIGILYTRNVIDIPHFYLGPQLSQRLMDRKRFQ